MTTLKRSQDAIRKRNGVPSRRNFLKTVCAASAAVVLPRRTTAAVTTSAVAARLPIAFSTLGCPKWEWKQILDFAAAHDYAALELRGVGGELELTKRPEFSAAQIAQSKRDVVARNLKIICLNSSVQMHQPDAAKRAQQMDDARRYIDLARDLGAPYVRVFGDKYVDGEAKEATRARIASGLRELGEYARSKSVTVLLETHGDFTDSASVVEILRQTASPQVALLWDTHHTFAFGKEQPEDTYRQLKPYVRLVEVKDSLPAANGKDKERRYVLTGAGDIPIERQIRTLARGGYRGYYAFEWEKQWHPEIEEPEVALAGFAEKARAYFADLNAPMPA